MGYSRPITNRSIGKIPADERVWWIVEESNPRYGGEEFNVHRTYMTRQELEEYLVKLEETGSTIHRYSWYIPESEGGPKLIMQRKSREPVYCYELRSTTKEELLEGHWLCEIFECFVGTEKQFEEAHYEEDPRVTSGMAVIEKKRVYLSRKDLGRIPFIY